MTPSRGLPSDKAEALRRPAKKRITDEEWLRHKTSISRLYLDEGKDVKDVRDTMRRQYSFEAHEKAYKRKFEEWGLTKNVPKDEGLFMVKKREERRSEGKNTVFWRRRRHEGPLQLVLDDKVDRIADRYSHDLNALTNVQTPENIEYNTPDDQHYASSVPATRRPGPTTLPRYEYPFPSVTNGPLHPIPGTTLPPMHSSSSMSGIPITMTSHPGYSGPPMQTALTSSMMTTGVNSTSHASHHTDGHHYYQAEAPVPSYIGHYQPTASQHWDPWTASRYH